MAVLKNVRLHSQGATRTLLSAQRRRRARSSASDATSACRRGGLRGAKGLPKLAESLGRRLSLEHHGLQQRLSAVKKIASGSRSGAERARYSSASSAAIASGKSTTGTICLAEVLGATGGLTRADALLKTLISGNGVAHAATAGTQRAPLGPAICERRRCRAGQCAVCDG